MEKYIHQVLIVDDEPYILQTAVALLEGHSSHELEIFKAYSADEALSIMCRRRIDVLITDIQMPTTSGLQLAHLVHHRWPECKIIVFTAHANFSYARHAMLEEVTAYVLKSEPDEKLIEAFDVAVHRLIAERDQVSHLARLHTIPNEHIYFLKQQAFQNLLTGSCKYCNESYKMTILSLGCTQPESPLLLACILRPQHGIDAVSSLKLHYLVERYINPIVDFIFCGLIDGKFYCLIQQDSVSNKALLDMMDLIVEYFYDISQHAVIGLVSPPIMNESMFSATCDRIRQYNMFNTDTPYVHSLNLQTSTDFQGSQILLQVRDYIDRNIYSDVSLETLASVVGYNASYLSRLFQKKTGITLSNYIANEKMKRIILLLQDPCNTIDKIVEETGFTTRSYFNRFVKRITGLSPKELRNHRDNQ